MIEAKAVKYDTIAVATESTVVAEYVPDEQTSSAYQSEAALEAEFIKLLQDQAYDYLSIKSEAQLIANLRRQLEVLNKTTFSDAEWDQLFAGWIAKSGDGIADKTFRLQEDYQFPLKRDDGLTRNISLIDKKNIHNN